jgi:hypothetical protein
MISSSAEFLRQIIKAMRSKGELLFLANYDDGEIVSDYSTCYSTQIIKFPNAKLIFDNEEQIKSSVESFVGDKSNYRFADSKDEPYLQVSDVIVGFFSKLISFLEKYEIDEIEDKVNCFNETQKDSLKLFFEPKSLVF